MRILIIGAGVGGLCLAQGLRAADLDVAVYERAAAPTEQLASYGIHLNADGCRALHECLPPANWARLDAVAAPARDTVRFHDQHLRPLAVRDNEPAGPPDPVTRRRAVSRDALRDVLLDGLAGAGGAVAWGRTFTGYERTSNGRLRARFADGSHADGDLLIGADGSNSRVRRQYLPELPRLDLGVLTVAGRCPLTPGIAEQLPAALLDGSVNNVVPPGAGWLFVSTWGAPDRAGTYVVWAYVAARPSCPPDVEQPPGARLRDLVLDRIEGWAGGLRTLVAASAPATVAPVALRSMPTLRPWPASTVTLLGDAVHNMTPMAGIGANTALRDAGVLRRALLEVGAGRRSPIDAVAGYEEQMRGYANAALSRSTRNARNAAAGARLPRLAFRTMLRAAEAVPPVKRAMFPST
ncbi:MAG TPA: NAD(P)/FAD-dependent oxidoreductase [Pseudonocardia sp.]|nr:NAD(P)/FAD-dependent oxidoreductase [Pseudonocardia sp.]